MELAKPKNFLDRLAIWCATYLIFVIAALGLLVAWRSGLPWYWILAAMSAAWSAAFLLQLVIRRPRPFLAGKPALIRMLWETPSFPSAHTAIGSSVVALIFLYGDRSALVLLLAVLVVLLAWSRVRVHVHYASDTVVGALTGILAAASVPSIFLLLGIVH